MMSISVRGLGAAGDSMYCAGTVAIDTIRKYSSRAAATATDTRLCEIETMGLRPRMSTIYSPTADEIALAERNVATYRERRPTAAARWG